MLREWKMERKERFLIFSIIAILCIFVYSQWGTQSNSVKHNEPIPSTAREINSNIIRVIQGEGNHAKVLQELLSNSVTRLQMLSNLIQRSFHEVQYPKDCDTAKVFICNLGDNKVGFAARLHEINFCHIIAYGLKRTLLITNTHFGLKNDGWPEEYFQTMNPCNFKFDENEVPHMQTKEFWSDFNNIDNRVRVMKYKHTWHGGVRGPVPQFLPGTVPRRLHTFLKLIHKDPPLWFIGQSMAFILRLQPDFAEELASIKQKIKFQSPIIGMHIRHGNKLGNKHFGAEAKYIPEHLFMKEADSYFEIYYPKLRKRNLYLATDDPHVLQNFTKTYPKYHFLSLPGVADNAQSYDSKSSYTNNVLRGIILDMILLSETDFVICTLSSNVGRAVHEYRQAITPFDETKSLHSMDLSWYYDCPGFTYSLGRNRLIAIRDFGNMSAKGDPTKFASVKYTEYMSHRKGDFITRFSGEFPNAISDELVCKGHNDRSQERGLIKMVNVIRMNPTPDYTEEKLNNVLELLTKPS